MNEIHSTPVPMDRHATVPRRPRGYAPSLAVLNSAGSPPRPISAYVVATAHGSDLDPHDHDDDVHALAVAAFVLVAPHAVRLVVPEGALGAVHAAAAHMRLAVRRRRLRGADGRVVGRAARAARLVQLRRRDQVLHDSAVDGELVRGVGRARRRGLRDQRLQDSVLGSAGGPWLARAFVVGREHATTRDAAGAAIRPREGGTYDDSVVPLLDLVVVVVLRTADCAVAGLGRMG